MSAFIVYAPSKITHYSAELFANVLLVKFLQSHD